MRKPIKNQQNFSRKWKTELKNTNRDRLPARREGYTHQMNIHRHLNCKVQKLWKVIDRNRTSRHIWTKILIMLMAKIPILSRAFRIWNELAILCDKPVDRVRSEPIPWDTMTPRARLFIKSICSNLNKKYRFLNKFARREISKFAVTNSC